MTTTRKPRPNRYTWAYKLWKLMHDEHGLILVESELQEIVDTVRAMKTDGNPARKPRKARKAAGSLPKPALASAASRLKG